MAIVIYVVYKNKAIQHNGRMRMVLGVLWVIGLSLI